MAVQRRQGFNPPGGDLGVLAGAMGDFQVLTGGRESEAAAGEFEVAREGAPEPQRRRRGKAPRHTYNVSDEVHRQAVSAADFLSGPPHREQLGKLVERAILAEVRRLETLHNGGTPFPEAQGRLRTGKRPGG